MRRWVAIGLVLAACDGTVLELTPPQISIEPSAIDFGPAPIGVRLTRRIQVRNPGAAPLRIASAAISGTGFQIEPSALVVAGGASDLMIVSAEATSVGAFTATLTLESDASGRPR